MWSREYINYLKENYLSYSDNVIGMKLSLLTGREFNADRIRRKRLQLGLYRIIGKFGIKPSRRRVLKFGPRTASYSYSSFNLGDSVYWVVALLEKPYYFELSQSLDEARHNLKYRFTLYLKGRRRKESWVDKERAAIMREWYSANNVTMKAVSRKFRMSYDIIKAIIRNDIFHDKNYVPKIRGNPRNSRKVYLFGETKSLRQWGLDSRCEVCSRTLYRRWNAGRRGEDLLRRF